MKFQNLKISSKLTLSFILTLISFLYFGAILFSQMQDNMLENKKIKTRHLVEVAYSIVDYHFKSIELAGLSVDVAQWNALKELEHLRYDEHEYFWVNDQNPRMLMHPYKPELNGKDLTNVKDPTGKAIFVAFVEATSNPKKSAFVDYMWPAPNAKKEDAPIAKVSYVKLFPEWGWIIGSGIYIDDIDRDMSFLTKKILPDFVLIFSILLVISFFIARGISTPVRRLSGLMIAFSKGDYSTQITDSSRKDEIGEMARSLQVFKDGLVEAEELRAKADLDRLEKERRQESIQQATIKFERTMSDVVRAVTSASSELQMSAQTLAGLAEETSVQSNAVSAASTETSANIQTVAASTEELSASIGEISQQVSKSTAVVDEAVIKSQAAIQSINKLVESAKRISEVTEVITDISGKTNLLALNATIEAARAGDTGKGFAVVANEVKGLAVNSAQSAGQISDQISQIQQDTRIAANAVEEITHIIEQVSQISNGIAAAIEEQAAATAEITRNVTEASNASVEVDQNISGVSQATASTGAAATQLSSSADDLGKQARILKEEFDLYIEMIKKA